MAHQILPVKWLAGIPDGPSVTCPAPGLARAPQNWFGTVQSLIPGHKLLLPRGAGALGEIGGYLRVPEVRDIDREERNAMLARGTTAR